MTLSVAARALVAGLVLALFLVWSGITDGEEIATSQGEIAPSGRVQSRGDVPGTWL